MKPDKTHQGEFAFWTPQPKATILRAVARLREMHKLGLLGGAQMPEDSNPGYDRHSAESYHYFTLPMALNYQRNSYRLWESANLTARDKETAFVFNPREVQQRARHLDEVRSALMRHKVALQPMKHTATWVAICTTLCDQYEGDLRNLFVERGHDVAQLLQTVQKDQKKKFPYLSGEKICNYWLYVMSTYVDPPLCGRQALSVAPDTHVLQASVRLGLVSEDVAQGTTGRQVVSRLWKELLDGSDMLPIDVHTPLWLWSRGGFRSID